MINIIRSILYALVGLAALGWISILLITVMLVGPDPDSFLTQYFSDNIIMTERLESVGQNFTDLSDGLFGLVAHMNIVLISVTTIMSLGWSAGSHYLNIDSPKKVNHLEYMEIFHPIYRTTKQYHCHLKFLLQLRLQSLF